MNKPLVASLILVGALGYFAGSRYGGRNSVVTKDQKMQNSLEEVRKTFPQLPDSNSITGQVESVNDNVIKLSTPALNPFDESPSVRKVVVTKSTKIIKSESKSAETIKKEQADYQKNISVWKPGSSEPAPLPPANFVKKEIFISDIKNGDRLIVEAVDSIRMVEEFTATSIEVQTMLDFID
jgi:hypothetical protein